MSRPTPTGFPALTENEVFRPIFLCMLAWPSGPVRAWTGLGPLEWNGDTYLGTGEMGQISPISESGDLRANGVTLSLSGIPESALADAMAPDAQGQAGKVWLGGLSESGTLVVDACPLYDGIIDVSPIDETGDTCTISVKLEKELIDRRLQNWRNTHEDHQIEAPDDLYFEYVAGLALKPRSFGPATLPAGRTPGSSNNSGNNPEWE